MNTAVGGVALFLGMISWACTFLPRRMFLADQEARRYRLKEKVNRLKSLLERIGNRAFKRVLKPCPCVSDATIFYELVSPDQEDLIKKVRGPRRRLTRKQPAPDA